MVFIFLPQNVSLDQLRAIREDGVKFGIAERHGCRAKASPGSLGGSREQPGRRCVDARLTGTPEVQNVQPAGRPMLPSIVASELAQVAADAIRTAFHPTNPGFSGLIGRFRADRQRLIKGPDVSISHPSQPGGTGSWPSSV